VSQSAIFAPMLALAGWTFAVMRVAHSVVHLSYNQVRHRLLVFGASNGVVVVMWVLAFVQVAR
jgi:hypothetical protein